MEVLLGLNILIHFMKKITLILSFIVAISLNAQQHIDAPFIQDFADKFELNKELNGSELLQVRSDRNKHINIVSTQKLLHTGEKVIAENNYFRPFENMTVISMEIYQDQFVYLTKDGVLSNAWTGKYYVDHGIEKPSNFVLGKDFSTLVAGENELAFFVDAKRVWKKKIKGLNPIELIADETGNRFFIVTEGEVYQFLAENNKFSKVYEGNNITAIALYKGKIILGTNEGVLSLDANSFEASAVNRKLPFNDITALENIDGSLWFGSKNGAFKLREDGKYDYYASKRWLVDNEVVDVAKGPDNSVLVLSKTGLSKISFVEMTLAEKAVHYQEIQRLRHIRYGYTSRLSLKTPGDLTSGVLHDSDNEGLWNSLYLASEIFRYAVTKSEEAKENVYEAFEAMERLEEISGVSGFPARTIEREGVELDEGSNGFSPEQLEIWQKENGKTWQLDETGRWKWKVSTSSDESAGHFFVYALLAELAPDKELKDRAIRQIIRQADHIINNNWRLVTWNGKPTRWGNWTPEYVNGFPINVGDRRLNSTLIIAFLQSAYHFTGDEIYKTKAYELINEHGYDENANRPASVIGKVEGEDLSDRWNHSDDQMYFISTPAFVNYSFSEAEKQKHFEASKSHWEIERTEKNPLWNFLYAMTGGTDFDLEDSVWWLQQYPMDLIAWSIDNSQREDLEKLEPNFRWQTYADILPRDEQPLYAHNGAYRNNANAKGSSESSPYIWLLPYWAGRYIDAISAPHQPVNK